MLKAATVLTWFLVFHSGVSATVQYGFYSPFPPGGGDQVLYDFSPVSESEDHFQPQPSKQGHRSTRDLAWKEFDAFLSGEAEPSCEDLRKMWRLARKMQEHAITTNQIPQEIHPFLSYSSKSSRIDGGSPETVAPVADNMGNYSPQKANRRRFSNPTASTTAASQQRLNEKENNNNKIVMEPKESNEEVYGVVHTSPNNKPTQQDNVVHVRDPAKEIFGLLRDRDPSYNHHSRQQPPVYGSIRTHSPMKSEQNNYMDVLQQKLFGKTQTNSDNDDSNNPTYGTVRYQVDNNDPPPSSFETVRGMMGSSNSNSRTDEGSSFDVIREKLMNTRQRNHPDYIKSLRRKNSRKRRRNAEEIALLEKQILNDYMTFRRSSTTLEKTEKKNQRKSNHSNNKKEKERQHKKKIQMEKEKARRKNLLLQKLGKK